jgi:hypothetical protein
LASTRLPEKCSIHPRDPVIAGRMPKYTSPSGPTRGDAELLSEMRALLTPRYGDPSGRRAS